MAKATDAYYTETVNSDVYACLRSGKLHNFYGTVCTLRDSCMNKNP